VFKEGVVLPISILEMRVDCGAVGASGQHVHVQWTRAELTAVREAIEVTPNFDGRLLARDLLRSAVLASRIVPVDTATATARAKLQLAVRKATEQAA
jgi:hypothetical protein